MGKPEEILAQIRRLSLGITEECYSAGVREGYRLLTELHDAGMEKERVYQALLQDHNALEDSPSRDYMADLLDYAAGWCSPQDRIWDE